MTLPRHCSICHAPLPPASTGTACTRCSDGSNDETILDSRRSSSAPPDHRHYVPDAGDDFGSYKILRLLGRGGMGHVFEVLHTKSGRRLALKVMGHELTNADDRQRFLREGQLAASVNHPNIVHIHGCEEVGGAPVISMEFVSGGTLAERVKSQGPFTPSGATEAILQLVDGLEAAYGAGILHRDIKPSNCFIQPDGTLKIGDFGLSISTLARDDDHRKATASTVGTPAYASPEQLRGSALDVRSDIYSVGATLYHLVTGKPPFTGPDVDYIIEAVLKTDPASPASQRPDLPPELARLILRCLAKSPKDRFANYAELRHALLPFRGGVLTPARPTIRFLADLVDNFVAYAPSIPFIIFWGSKPIDEFLRHRTSETALFPAILLLWRILYCTVMEGRFGAGLGKRLCGLRVVGADGQPPGFWRGLLRTTVNSMREFVPPLILLRLFTELQMQSSHKGQAQLISETLWLLLLAALFLTMRRANGFRALHDWASGTQVVLRPENQPRPALATMVKRRALQRPKTQPTPRENSTGNPEVCETGGLGLPPQRFGPYLTQEVLWHADTDQLVSARDPILGRAIWIHRLRPDLATDNPARHELSRPTRLRWLQGGIDTNEVWNAYEAPSGLAFLEVVKRRQPWRAVRFWLQDLTTELDPSHPCPSAPEDLAPHRLWITSSGRTLALDFPAPILDPKNYPLTTHHSLSEEDFSGSQRFLAAIARLSLRGLQRRGRTKTSGPPEVAVPLHARAFLQNLASESFQSTSEVLSNLATLVTQPAEISRLRRAASMLLVPGTILLMGIVASLVLQVQMSRKDQTWGKQFPNQTPLSSLWHLRETHEDSKFNSNSESLNKRRLINVYIARHYAAFITNDVAWNAPALSDSLEGIDRDQLRQIVDTHANPSPETLETAEKQVPIDIRSYQEIKRLLPLSLSFVYILGGIPIMALIELFGILFSRSSPVLRLFGITLVDSRGAKPTRLRLGLRWLIGWGCLIAVLLELSVRLTILINERFHLVSKSSPLSAIESWSSQVSQPTLFLVALVFIALASSLQNTACGLFDRVFGTRLVLRA